MRPSAPARSGLFPDRLVPRLSAALGAIALAACTATGPQPGASASGAANESAETTEDAATGSPAAAPRRATGAQDGSSPAQGASGDSDAGAPAPGGAAPVPGPDAATGDGTPAPEAGATGHEDDSGADPARPDGELPEVALTSQLMFQLLASEIAAQRGDLGSAVVTCLAMARQTGDPRLAQRATEFALAGRMLDRALAAAELWHELAPSSPRAAQALETLLLTSGHFERAEPLLRARLARARAQGRLASVYQQIQRALVRAPDSAAALAMLERLAAPDGRLPAARMAVAAQARAAGDIARAASEARTALALSPDDEAVAVTAARYVAESEAGADAAIALLQDYLKREPRSVDARFALALLLAAEDREDDARRQLERVLAEQPENPAVLFSLAQLAWQMEQPQEAERFLRRYLELPAAVPRDDDLAWLFLGQMAEEQGRVEDAIEHYGRVRNGEQALPALIRRALLVGRQGRVDEARALLREQPASSNRDRVQLIAAEAQVLREADRDHEALELLGEALERLPENPDLLYDYGMAAERVGRLDLMESSLRRLIALRPDHAHAYNALGYTFADRDIRLDEAEELIARALSLRPDDPHIIDSMGWLRYRRGDLPGAIELLRKAWSLSPEIDIAAHLGEVLWQAGRTDEARRLWRDAHEREPDNATLKETLSRFNVSP